MSAASTYFPPGILEEFYADWFRTHLQALNEQRLHSLTGDIVAYRFLWLRTFDEPIAVRAQRENDRPVLHVKRTSGEGGFDPGVIALNVTRQLAETEWVRIEKEPDDLAYLLLGYVALLALVPAVFGFIGACFVGAVVPGRGLVHASMFDAVFGAIFGYVLSFVIVALLGLFIDLVAPQYGGRRDFASAFRLAVYSYTPVWFTGIFLLLPGLRFGLAGLDEQLF